ncbi:uncharacterized protein [Dermacentor albipictus]|uniref:uncharacterized protein isoform X3 n=1 Tax=Dermacentor albipictus TaxID=60249 RepID=UPI0038FCBD11
MTEQRSSGQTPPAFAFIEEATPGTSREGGEGASGTCDDIPAYIDEYINDALKALKRQTNATDVNDATDSGSTNYAPVVSTASANHAWPRTSQAGIEKLSSTTKDTMSCFDDAWRCQLNAQHRPITNQTYSLDVVALVTCTWGPQAASITKSPAQAALEWWRHQQAYNTEPEILRPRGFTKATRSTTRLQAHPPSRGMHTTETPEAPVSHFHSTAAVVVANTQWPVQATRARRKHRAFREMMLEFLTPPALSHGVRRTTQLVAQLQSPAIHMSLKAESPVPYIWCPAAASITHSPVQAALEWRRHRPFRRTSLEFLTPPALSHGVRTTTRLVVQLQSTMSRAVVALLACPWGAPAASITHCPAQAALA